MKIRVSYFISLVLLIISVLAITTDYYKQLVYVLGGILLFSIIAKLGKGIVLRESTAFLYAFTCLIMPLVGYTTYTSNSGISRLWVKYMPIPFDDYFSFTLPAISLFCLALTYPLSDKTNSDEGESLVKTVKAIKSSLVNKAGIGLQLLVVGSLLSIIAPFMPAEIRFFIVLFYFASFAGLLYVYYSTNFKYKKLILFLFSLIILANAVQTGMFTIVAYMGITIFSFFFLGSATPILKKLLFLSAAVIMLVVLQNAKITYRALTWKSGYEGNKALLLGEIFVENLQKGTELIEEESMFPIYARTNQGFNVALVMRRMPAIENYDNGEMLFKNIASAFVPRFLWPDKPQAGGASNMLYYAGMRIRGWSTNVGPLGEAYGSFGPAYGVVFMFLLGVFIRWAYKKLFDFSVRIPLLICWMPVLFYQVTYSAEADTLQITNSLIKASFFVWLLIKFMPTWFNLGKNQVERKKESIIKSYA